jgi:biotin operon repressor
MPLPICLAVLIAAATFVTPSFAANPNWSQVGKALGKAGTTLPDGVYRVGLPRTDLKVSVDGVSLKPGFALGGWIAFDPMGNQAMVMGDIVLTQDEVNPVMKKLEESGIEITALHNHLLRAEPMTLYMHVFGQGDPVTLATALHAGLALSKTPIENAASGAVQPQASTQQFEFDTAAVDHAIGHKGKANGGVYQFTIPRAETITDSGMAVPASMGTAIAINFQPTGGGKAAITGDFVLIASEVNPVLQALRENGIEVTAVHNHMLDDQPRLFFMHFWANHDAAKLARGLKAALDKMNLANS